MTISDCVTNKPQVKFCFREKNARQFVTQDLNFEGIYGHSMYIVFKWKKLTLPVLPAHGHTLIH